MSIMPVLILLIVVGNIFVIRGNRAYLKNRKK